MKRTSWISNAPVSGHAQEGTFHSEPNIILLDCIDAVLSDVLGVKVREAVYDHLARHASLGKEEIPDHLDEFSGLLRKTFGRGAATLERCIAKRFYKALGCEFIDVTKFSLQSYISLLKNINGRDIKTEDASTSDRPKV